jgi:hypothetical protein
MLTSTLEGRHRHVEGSIGSHRRPEIHAGARSRRGLNSASRGTRQRGRGPLPRKRPYAAQSTSFLCFQCKWCSSGEPDSSEPRASNARSCRALGSHGLNPGAAADLLKRSALGHALRTRAMRRPRRPFPKVLARSASLSVLPRLKASSGHWGVMRERDPDRSRCRDRVAFAPPPGALVEEGLSPRQDARAPPSKRAIRDPRARSV